MQLASDFNKMRFVLTGNRFTGVNIIKTGLNFDLQKSEKINGVSFAVIFTLDINYVEIEDTVKYEHRATIEIDKVIFYSQQGFGFMKQITIQLEAELNRRYEASAPFKLLELPTADKIPDEKINDSLSRIIADYKNKVR